MFVYIWYIFVFSFELNTCIDYPHEKSVNSILFSPPKKDDNLICVTVADDKKFKVWKLMDFENIYSMCSNNFF